MNKKTILQIIKEWKASQKILDLTDKGLVSLAQRIILYESKRKREK